MALLVDPFNNALGKLLAELQFIVPTTHDHNPFLNSWHNGWSSFPSVDGCTLSLSHFIIEFTYSETKSQRWSVPFHWLSSFRCYCLNNVKHMGTMNTIAVMKQSSTIVLPAVKYYAEQGLG